MNALFDKVEKDMVEFKHKIAALKGLLNTTQSIAASFKESVTLVEN